MTHPLPDKAVEAGARALVRHHAWSSFWAYDDARQLVQTAVTAALAAEGLVVVPREPSGAQLAAVTADLRGPDHMPGSYDLTDAGWARRFYRAMIEAAREG